ncbi:MAG: acylphosphatase [Methanomicrobiales archaeon]
MKRIVVNVRGRVQGVGYRYYVADYAQQTGISGYVRNIPDGSVQVIAEGSEDSLLQFVRYLHGPGDPVICVEHLRVEWDVATGDFLEFSIRR